MLATLGIDPKEWEGPLPGGEEGAAAPPPDTTAIDERIEELRDPERQFRFIHAEARDNDDAEAIEMNSEVLVIEWTDANGHVFRTDDKPQMCSDCRSKTFTQTREEVELRKVRMPLHFTQVEVHRKKVYERIEHFATVVRAEMTRLSPDAVITPEWMSRHRGYAEIGLTSPAARTILRELFLSLALSDAETIDGIVDSALTVAGIALISLHTRRQQEAVKKAGSPPPPDRASGSPTSTKS